MRLSLRAGIVLALCAAACGEDPTPVDFENPAAVSANLAAVDSAFDSDAFRSFNSAVFMIGAFATAPAMRPAATLLEALQPKLERSGAQAFLPQLLQARKLQALVPQLSVSAAQGAIIPDSLYGRVYEWNDTTSQYVYRDSTVSNLNGVRFILYAVGLDGDILLPLTTIGTLDLIDQSTASVLRLNVLVKNPAGTTTFVDYTADLTSSTSSAVATASGTITNGRAGAASKTLNFDETFTVNFGGVRVTATFALDNPAITLMLNETVTADEPNLIITANFRIIQAGETIRTFARITVNTETQEVLVHVAVSVDGHPVASFDGDPTLPGTVWVDAGGEPLTLEDLAALDHLFDALESFDQAVAGFFAPIGVFMDI